MLLQGKVAAITGAASGIGRACALLFAQHGAKIAVVDIDRKGAQETVDLITQKGNEAISVYCDVSDDESSRQMVETIKKRFGRIDILHCNAGIFKMSANIEDMDVKDWDKIFATNVRGPFLNAKYAIPGMKQQGSGVIIITSSCAALRPRPGQVAYASTKASSTMLAKALAIELASYNIRVNAIGPALIDTPMLGELGDELKAKMATTVPLGRIGKAEEVANAALFLASDNSSLITGVLLEVDGGRAI
jgi:3-oxoacyl-[acyl-carrier protein] reductase